MFLAKNHPTVNMTHYDIPFPAMIEVRGAFFTRMRGTHKRRVKNNKIKAPDPTRLTIPLYQSVHVLANLTIPLLNKLMVCWKHLLNASLEYFRPQLGPFLGPNSDRFWGPARTVFGAPLRLFLGPSSDCFWAPTQTVFGSQLGPFLGPNSDRFWAPTWTVFGPQLGPFLGPNLDRF